MDEKTILKKLYKENPPPAGIFVIRNKANGKILIGKAMDVHGKLKGQQAQLEWRSHTNRALQQDWNGCGKEHFDFEVLDCLEKTAGPEGDKVRDLAELERLWLDKLTPYGDKGYNTPPKTKG